MNDQRPKDEWCGFGGGWCILPAGHQGAHTGGCGTYMTTEQPSSNPSNDIVAKLRATEEWWTIRPVCVEAADEISRLRQVNSGLDMNIEERDREIERLTHDIERHLTITSELATDIERLRAALERIMDFTGTLTRGTTHYEGCADDHPMCQIWCMAQGALSFNGRPADETASVPPNRSVATISETLSNETGVPLTPWGKRK